MNAPQMIGCGLCHGCIAWTRAGKLPPIEACSFKESGRKATRTEVSVLEFQKSGVFNANLST